MAFLRISRHTMLTNIEDRFSQGVIGYRWWILLATLVLVTLAASGARLLTFTSNHRVFFSEHNPQLLTFEAFENTYAKNDNVLFVLAPRDGRIFSRDSQQALLELTQASWQIPYSTRVDSITNFQHTRAESDDLVVGNLVADLDEVSAAGLDDIRAIALAEPLLVNRLIAPSAAVSGINITVELPRLDETAEIPEVVAAARNLMVEFRQRHPDIAIYAAGVVLMNNAFSESSKHDLVTLVPASFALMMLILWLVLRGFAGVFGTCLVIVFSILSAMGIGGYLGFPLSPPSVSAPTIILTMAIANCVHIMVSVGDARRRGTEGDEAIREGLRVNLQPVSLASVTTAIGFLSMNFSDVPPFHHLGNLVAIGVLISFVLSISFLPALVAVLPARPLGTRSVGRQSMAAVAEFVIRFRGKLLVAMSGLILALVASVPRNELNDVFVHYFDESVDFRVAADFTTDNLTGMYRLEYSLESGEPGGISEPTFLTDIDQFAMWYRQQPEVLHVSVLSDILKRLNRNMHADEPVAYRLPESRELAAQYLLLYEMSLPYGLDLNNQLNIDKSATRMTVSLRTISSNQVLDLERRANAWLRTNASHITRADATGSTVMFAKIGKRNISGMLVGTSVALVVISMLLMVAFRSVKIGLISLAPNLVPGAMGFGLWGIFVGEVGLSLSVVTGMTLGIVVDDTVHFLSKYLRARREQGLSPEDAVRYAFTTVGWALAATSLILVSGFFVLSLSSFELNAGMGLLTAIVITLALVADFFFLPPLLMKVAQGRSARTPDAKRNIS